MSTAILTSKGQLTLPKAIREYLKVDTGDRLEFFIDKDGKVIITTKHIKVDDIYGILTAKKGLSIEDMNLGIKQATIRRFKRHEKH